MLKLESQSLSLTLIHQWSIGYPSAADVTPAKERALLEADSAPRAPKNPGDLVPPLSPSLLQQEERAGQHMEKRLRDMFGLEERRDFAGPSVSERRGSLSGGESNSPRESSMDRLAAPSRFDQLLPEVAPFQPTGDDGASSSSSARSRRPVARLTAVGRAQIKAGRALCSKANVPVLGDEEDRPVCTYEYETLVRLARVLTERLRQRTGKKVDLRFIASQAFVNFVLVLLAGLLLLWTIVG